MSVPRPCQSSGNHHRRAVSARLLPLLLAAGWLAVAGPVLGGLQSEPEQGRAVAALRKLGAGIVVDEASAGKPVVAVDLSGCAVTEAGLAHLHALTQIRTLDL